MFPLACEVSALPSIVGLTTLNFFAWKFRGYYSYTLLNLTLKIEVNHQVIPVSKMFLNPNLQDVLDSAVSVNAGYAHVQVK